MLETYQYRAIDPVGRQTKGLMEARNVADLEVRLQQMGLDLTTVKLSKKSWSFFASNKVSQRDLALFCFQLEQLMIAGVPILAGLNDVAETIENGYFKKVLGAIYSEIEGGKTLSEALEMHRNVFDEVFVSLVSAGEQTGKLQTVFHHLTQTLKWQDALFSHTRQLLTYPLFIFFIVMMAVAFLMIFLVPQLVQFMENLGQALPWNTQILIWISGAFVNYWWLIIGTPIVLIFSITAWIRTHPGARYQWDGIKLKLPLVGDLLHKIIMARFARYFALMYQAGIPILTVIRSCESIVGNRVVASALDRIHERINAGNGLSESFRQAGLFPSLVMRMIAVGERSGTLDQALMHVSYFYDREVDERLKYLLKMLEPALTVILGLVLLFIMAAVLGPVYESFSHMPL